MADVRTDDRVGVDRVAKRCNILSLEPFGRGYADQFSGAPDLGIQINNAVTSLRTVGKGVIRIRPGTYVWSTQVTIDPRLVSIQGEGGTARQYLLSEVAMLAAE